VWLRDPSEYLLGTHPTADMFISTDCLSYEVEAAWQPGHNQPRCGHVPGNGWGRAFNTGVFAMRNRPASTQLLEDWRDALENGPTSFQVGRHSLCLFPPCACLTWARFCVCACACA